MSADATTATPILSNGAIVRRLFAMAWRYRVQCLAVLGIQLLLLSIGISGLSFTGLGIDYIRHVVEHTPLGHNPLHLTLPDDQPKERVLGMLAALILFFGLARSVLNYAYAIAINKLLQQNLVVTLRGQVYDKLQRLSFRFFDANATGSVITRATGDVQSVRSFLDQVLMQTIIMIISLAIYITYMASLSLGLTLACLASTPLVWFASTWFSRKIQPEYTRNRTLVEQMVQVLSEAIQGIAVTKAFGREAESQAKFNAANQACLEQQRGIFWRVSVFSPAVGFLTRINTMVLLGYGGWLVAHDELPLGTGLVVFAGLLENFSGQVGQLSNIVNSVQQSLIGARRVFEILDSPLEVQDAPDAIARPHLQGAIIFENVSFAYDSAQPVVRDVDLSVAPGQCVALLGTTGAGKSVLMSLIPRFFDPTSGRILIDGIDLRELRLTDLRRSIGLVFQESFLFSNTVANNIAFGQPNATREQIEKAAKIAKAHDFVVSMPQGYDTVLGESGNTLSGGQRQRLAIARAVLLEPSILLLDDPTAAIDSETEHEIFEALDHAIAGRTTFIVAHRLSTLRRADQILVMEHGRIVQRGTHDELMRMPGPYVRVAKLQLIDPSELEPLGLLAEASA